MKSFIVLCSLVTFATAVPVYQGNFIESSINNLPLGTKRERKSAFPDASELSLEQGIDVSPIYDSQKPNNGISRNFKKPIVIKKKFGYHVYRDSDEELAHSEPGEKCREKVKFKMCDHEPIITTKSGVRSSCANVQKSNNDIENSIRMAKEAMEFVQRDLKRMQNFSPKMGNTHVEDTETNSELHHDIEVAREALEHIEDNLESMDLDLDQITKEKELELPKTIDEESITKWKEAINNIQKNFEIVKNIEDAFKSDNYYSLPSTDSRKEDNLREVELLEDNVKLDSQFSKDKSENKDDTYLRTASNEGFETFEQKSKFDSEDSVEKDANIFTSVTNNNEANMLLHSDSLKSEITKFAKSADSKEYNENTANIYKFSDSLSNLAEDFVHEKIPSDGEDITSHEISSKAANQFRSSIEGQEPEEHQSAKYESQSEKEKTVLPENELPLMKLKAVEETLENRKEQAKVVDNYNYQNLISNEHIDNGNLENSENNLMPKSTVLGASEKVKDDLKIQEDSGKEIEENAEKADDSRVKMFFSDEFLEKASQLAEDHLETTHEEEMELPISFKEKHVQTSSEEHIQKDEKLTQMKLDEQEGKSEFDNNNNDAKFLTQFKNPLEISDELKYDRTSDLENDLSIIGQDQDKISLNQPKPLVSNLENKHSDQMRSSMSESDVGLLNIFSPLDKIDNDHTSTQFKSMSETDNSYYFSDPAEQLTQNLESPQTSLHTTNSKHVSENEDKILQEMKAVSELQSDKLSSKKLDSNEDILKFDTKLRLSQNQDDTFDENNHLSNVEKILIDNYPENSQMLKSVSDHMIPIPFEENEKINNQHFLKENEDSMRLSEKQNEKLHVDENQKINDYLSNSKFENQLNDHEPRNSVQEHHDNKLLTNLSNQDETRMSQDQDHKLNVSGNEDRNHHMFMSSNDGKQVEDTLQISKSVTELNVDEIKSNPVDEPKMAEENNSFINEDSLRLSQSQNDKLLIDENHDIPDPIPFTGEIEKEKQLGDQNGIEKFTMLPKSVPELKVNAMTSEIIDETEDVNEQHTLKKEGDTVRMSENQNGLLKLNDNQDIHEHSLIGSDIGDVIKDHNIAELSKSDVSEVHSSKMVVMPSDKVEIFNEQDSLKSLKEEENMRQSQIQELQFIKNHHDRVPELNIEEQQKDSQLSKSVPELQVDKTVSMPSDKTEKSDDHHLLKPEEVSMRLSQNQNEELHLDENHEFQKHNSMGSDNEKESKVQNAQQLLKSALELNSDDLASSSSDNDEETIEQHNTPKEGTMRLSEIQNDRIDIDTNHDTHTPLTKSLDIDKQLHDQNSLLAKSVLDFHISEGLVNPPDEIEESNDQYLKQKESSMRLSQEKNEKLWLNENQEDNHHDLMNSDTEKHFEDRTIQSQFSKSVPELPTDEIVSTSLDKLEMTNEQNSLKEKKENMKLSENQDDQIKLTENHGLHDSLLNNPENQVNPNHNIQQLTKSVPEVQLDQMITIPAEKDETSGEQKLLKEQNMNMRLSENQNSKIEINKLQDIPMNTNLDSDNFPEIHTMHLLKSVPETQGEKMISMASEQVAVTASQDALPKQAGNKMSGNKNEIIKVNESPDTHKQLSADNVPEDHMFLVKSIPESQNNEINSMPTNKVDNANTRLSHNQHDEQRWNLNNHAIPVDTTQTFKSFNGFDSKEIQTIKSNSVPSQNEQFVIENEEFMRFSQDRNEGGLLNKNDPRMNLGFRTETWNRNNNAENTMDDQTYFSLTHDQLSHRNNKPMSQWPKETQQLNQASQVYKSTPEYRIVPSMDTFEFNERQNALHDQMNMRVNQETMGPEKMENQNLHNSYKMPWNIEKQLQDEYQKTYKSTAGIANERMYNFKDTEYEGEQKIPEDVTKMRNIPDYETKQRIDEHNWDKQSMRWVQSKQHNNHFSNFYKNTPDIHEGYDLHPHFRNHFHRVVPSQEFGNIDTYSHDYPYMRSRIHDRMQMYHQGKSSDLDSSIESNARMHMREPFTKSVKEFGHNHQYFSHPHGVARFGTALPLGGAGSGAVGVFPTANAGGCGIPLFLSCSPSVVSGSLAKSHITGPAFKSEDENGMHYTNMKREAMNIDDLPIMKIQKSHNHNQAPVHVHE